MQDPYARWLWFHTDHPGAQSQEGTGAVAHVGPDVEAQVARVDKRPVEATQEMLTEWHPIIQGARAQDAYLLA